MLKVPAFQYYEDLRVTVYQDDTEWWKFYLLPDYVSIRKDINGDPVFLLVKYAFGDQDREENEDLPRGGGLMAFDIELTVQESDEPDLRDRLQSYVDREWNRLKSFADAANHDIESLTLNSWHNRTNGVPRPAGDPTTPPSLTIDDVSLGLNPDRPTAPPGDAPPQIQLSYPEFTEGTFTVLAPQSDGLVTHSITEGPLSLTGPNTAAVMIELTEAGATFMQQTLVETSGVGATNLVPLGARMDLKFKARIPPASLHVKADTRSVYKAMESIDHDYDDYACREDDIAHYETMMEAAIESKLIDVTLDTGELDLESDLVEELMGISMELIRDLLSEELFEETDPPDDVDDDLLKEKTDYYIMKQEERISFKTMNTKIEINSIIEAEKHPQGTMQAFFAGVPKSKMNQFVRVVNLDDDFFKTLGLTVNCFADWENDPIAFVEVQIQYDGRNEQGQIEQKQETFTFDKDTTSGEWDPSLIGKQRGYKYRWRLAYTGQEAGEFSRWEKERSPMLNITVPSSGRINLPIIAGNVDFQQTVQQVQIAVSYEDRSDDVASQTENFVLMAGQLEQTYSRDLFTDWDKEITYKPTFILKDGQVIEGDEQSTDERSLLINAPLFDKLDVNFVLVASQAADIAQVLIDVRYDDDANDYHVDEVLRLKDANEFKSWSVVLQDRDNRNFRYKAVITFNDGTMTDTGFIEMEGDQTIPIKGNAPPRLNVTVMPSVIDFGTTPLVTCDLRYRDPDNAIDARKTLFFDTNNKAPVPWTLPISDSSRQTYSYDVDYHALSGTIDREEIETDDGVLVIKRAIVPEVKCIFTCTQINFTDTPVVELQIEYTDPVNGNDMSDTLIVSSVADNPVFQHMVQEDSPREFTLTRIYHLADGQVHQDDPQVINRKRYVIPRHMPDPVVVEEPDTPE
ncbi:hypothetical protein [Pontixanthobacter aquaemixtae]|uniref:Uncharacterized protein n=1 Tax=Pontixanthobacter aquaemixtae TaxID=1958940 RepID=A0A844ZTQ0_9SPHN|nr:hypothetical protein [Pontixanthobacter aquaemixtae]MXO90844.1 hypothetical protein [Pontixanthobacter aquaemixtae]